MGKQNWSIFEVNFQLVYKIISYFQSIFDPNYASDYNNFSKITLGASSLYIFLTKDCFSRKQERVY